MTKQEAQTLIKTVIPKTHLIMISIPIIHFPQDVVEGNPFEQHIKDDWSHDEVLESFPNIISAFIHDFMGVYFLSTNTEFSQIIRTIQSQISTLVKKIPLTRSLLGPKIYKKSISLKLWLHHHLNFRLRKHNQSLNHEKFLERYQPLREDKKPADHR